MAPIQGSRKEGDLTAMVLRSLHLAIVILSIKTMGVLISIII